jgi:hypothetical protein
MWIDVSLWLLGPAALGLWPPQDIMEGAVKEEAACLMGTRKQRDRKGLCSHNPLQGHTPNNLTSPSYAGPLKGSTTS